MGEMKAGLTMDENGEYVDASKVETALKSVGVALRDSQGQFRDMDDVIIELASQWSTLDSATQRYLGTVIAGNRQQSRFLALMENYDRLVEVQEAAVNSEDAGLVQYAKTLDSLDAKLNQLSNNFQTFYMSIFNGDFFKGVLDIINNIVTSVSRLGTVMGTIKVVQLINQIKLIGQLLLNMFTPVIQQFRTMRQNFQNEFTSGWEPVGTKIAQEISKAMEKVLLPFAEKLGIDMGKATAKGANEGAEQTLGSGSGSGSLSKGKGIASKILYSVGTAATAYGMTLDTSTESGYQASNWLQIGGGAATAVGQALSGDFVGAALTAVSTIAQGISYVANYSEVMYENAKKAAEEANIERATKASESRNLESTINNLKKLQKAQYDSEEAQQEYIDACNTAAETYPELVSSFTTSGDAIIDVVNDTVTAENLLAEARKEAADATYDAAAAELNAIEKQIKNSNIISEKFSDDGYARTIMAENSGTKAWLVEPLAEQLELEAYELSNKSGNVFTAVSLSNEKLLEFARLIDSGEFFVDGKNVLEDDKVKEWFQEALNGVLDITELGEGQSYTGLISSLLSENDSLFSSRGAARQAVNRSYANQWITTQDALEEADWRELSGIESLLTHYLDDQIDESYYKDGKLTDTAQEELASQLSELYNSVESFTKDMGNTAIEKWNTAVEEFNKGIITVDEYYKALESTGLDLQSDIGQAITKTTASTTVSSYERIGKLLGLEEKDSFVHNGKTYASLEEFGQDFELDAYNIKFYLSKMFGEDDIFNNILNLPLLYAEQVANEISDLNDIIADDAIPAGQKAAAEARKELLTSFDYDLIPEELRSEFYSLLTTDMGTSVWAESLQNWIQTNVPEAEKYFDVIVKGVYENAVTRLQSLVDDLTAAGDQIKEYESKQSSGWTYNESRAFLQALNDLDDGNRKWEDYFAVNETTGQLELINYAETMDEYWETVAKGYEEQQKVMGEVINSSEEIAEVFSDYAVQAQEYVGAETTEEQKAKIEEDLRSTLKNLGITDEVWLDELVEIILTGEEEDLEELMDDLTEAQQDLLRQAGVAADLQKYSQRATKFSEYSNKFSQATSAKSFLSASNVSDLENLFTIYGGNTSAEEFFSNIGGAVIDQFGNITITNIREYAAWLAQKMADSGVEFNTEDFQAEIADTVITFFEAISDMVSSALEGSLSAANLKQLQATLGGDGKDITKYFTLTSEGYKLNKGDTMAFMSDYTAWGRGEGLSNYAIAEDVAKWLTDTYEISELYEIVDEQLKTAQGDLKDILQIVRNIAEQMSDTRKFDFMNVDALDGAADNLDKLTSSMSSAISTLQSAMEGDGKVSYKQFESMFQWMEDFGEDTSFSKALEAAGITMEQFGSTVRKTLDYAGNVDLGSVLSEMGGGFENFGASMGETFKEIAAQQAEYWDKQADFFEKLAVMAGELEGETLQVAPELDLSVANTEAQATAMKKEWVSKIQQLIDSTFGEGTFATIYPGIDIDNLSEENIATLQGFVDIWNSGDTGQIQEWATGLGLINTDLASIAGIEMDTISDKATAVEKIGKAAEDADGFIQKLIESLGKIPDIITTTIKVTTSGVIGKAASVVSNLFSKAATGGDAQATGGIAAGGKTLVGELGPELGVYDGTYHLLGQNGAEFVDLPKQALVFNHLQTEALLRGQSGVRIGGTAMASGNVSGPAFASGYAAAAQRAREIADLWQGLAETDVNSLLNSASSGGGGGGDNTIKATIQDLEEWYNLSRKIANVEQEINNIVAERENITEGDKYLRSLRQQQVLLREQESYQKKLLNYQQLQLQRQADLINQNKLWSQFLTVTEEGLLQYVNGNETNGGKGALEVLQDLNEMSGEEQVAFLNKLGYSYTDNDGNVLEGEELVQQFFDDLQSEIDKYDDLYDTVHETEETLEELESDVSEINDEIRDNQMDLEKEIFDIIVDAWQEQIDQMKEQNDLVKQANEDYVNGLNDALSKERELYNQNESVAEREAAQRRLALLQRSGGSATEIANLQDEIDDMLQDEYFDSQEDMINNIQEANDRQVELLEQQVQLQTDALEYEKENGVIWTKVYEIMAGTDEEILKFMQGNYTQFFAQSLLQQEDMLTDWAMKIGIYTEDRQYKNYEEQARNIFEGALSTNQNTSYKSLSANKQAEIQDLFASTYANALLSGKTADEAKATALAAISESLPNTATSTTTTTPTISTGGSTSSTATGTTRSVYAYGTQKEAQDGYAVGDRRVIRMSTDSYDEKAVRSALNGLASRRGVQLDSNYKIHGFSEGGLVDYTGIAAVHGSASKPEAFLNAEQTAQIREALTNQGRGNVLNNILSAIQGIGSSLSSFISNSSSVVIEPGAIQITVDELNDVYDINDVSNDIMNRITNIASKATNTGVSRR